jgi:hypothetical protein
MTTANNINEHTILTLLLRNKSFQPIRAKYKINYHCITVLLACYVYSVYIRDEYSINAICLLIGYFSRQRLIRYFDSLVSNNLIALAGPRKYKLTPEGFHVIQSISVNMDQILYKFCNDHNINL